MKTANKTKTIQVRLTEEDYEYLTDSAYAMGTNPSRLVRQLIQMSINAAKVAKKQREELKAIEEEKKNALMNAESDVVVNAD